MTPNRNSKMFHKAGVKEFSKKSNKKPSKPKKTTNCNIPAVVKPHSPPSQLETLSTNKKRNTKIPKNRTISEAVVGTLPKKWEE